MNNDRSKLAQLSIKAIGSVRSYIKKAGHGRTKVHPSKAPTTELVAPKMRGL
jgi:hypothetical protein